MVCAVSLVGQWLDEAKSKLDGSLRLYMYHGSGRTRDTARLAHNYDLVGTTYQVRAERHPCTALTSCSLAYGACLRADEVIVKADTKHNRLVHACMAWMLSLPAARSPTRA